jgi:hypothetical protein
VERVVRQNFGRVRLCYEQVLKTNARAAGAVQLSFSIRADGSVKTPVAIALDGTLPDAMKLCLGPSFQHLMFPGPEGGEVSVALEIVVSP